MFFWTWISLTILAAAYVAIAAPFVAFFGASETWVGAFVPPLMILLLGIGLAWLVYFVTGENRRGGLTYVDKNNS